MRSHSKLAKYLEGGDPLVISYLVKTFLALRWDKYFGMSKISSCRTGIMLASLLNVFVDGVGKATAYSEFCGFAVKDSSWDKGDIWGFS